MRNLGMLLAGLAFCLTLMVAPAAGQNNLSADLLRLADAGQADFDTIEALINDGANVDAADANGETVLMKAARSNSDIAVAELLVGWGAAINAVDKNYETALMKAARYNFNPRMTEFLGRLGAALDMVDDQGETALMKKACKYTANEEVVAVLLLLGADPQISANRKTALDFAKKNSALKGTETLDILQTMSQ